MHFRSRAATPYYEGETLRELMIMSVVLTAVVTLGLAYKLFF